MVAANLRVIYLEQRQLDHLRDSLRQGGQTAEVRFVLEGDFRGRRRCLLVSDRAITHAAWGTRIRRAGDLDSDYRLSSIIQARRPIPLVDIAPLLVPVQRGPLQEGGDLSPRASQRVIEELLILDPAFGAGLGELGTTMGMGGTEAKVNLLNQQRDAVASLLNIANMDPSNWKDSLQGISERETLLPTAGGSPREDPMIGWDASLFRNWHPSRVAALGWTGFEDSRGRRLEIANVNRDSAESILGADLIYYHVQRRSFVLVQYKRMKREGQDWIYRPDDQLDKQLERMREIDALDSESGDDGDFRLRADACLVKLCKVESRAIDDLSLVPGMYLYRHQVERHRKDLGRRGPKNGEAFSFENVEGYLTNTVFTDLVAYGLIGSRGTTSEYVARQLDISLEGVGSVVVGILDDPFDRRRGPRVQARRLSIP